ncbi:MAG: glycerophosphodiester phosphodiesterase family protein [Alphaproteobacteria bacterium]|nr:glycerophosphodiester phosphodiesterase family protein [Alphaproteobacteria bacterium]
MTRIFDLQGHRGARGLFPENTIEGFRATSAIGVDSIELDVAVTADGVAIVSHDPTLDPDLTRGPDGKWIEGPERVIRAMTLAEIQRYDVGRIRPGSTLARRFPHQMPRDGAGMPTLEEVFRALPGMRIHAEIKTLPDRPALTVPPAVMAEAIVAAAQATGALGRLAVRSFDWRGLAYLAGAHPAIPLVWLTSPGEAKAPGLWWDMPDHTGSTPAAVARAAGRNGEWQPAWAPRHDGLTREAIAEAHAIGLLVMPWTVDDAGDIDRLIDWGVDGICTDRPDVARTVMLSRGMALPTAR